MSNERNRFGLYDAPNRALERERVTFTQDEMQRQLEAGAFALSREEAVAAGFLNPLEEPDAVLVDIAREEA